VVGDDGSSATRKIFLLNNKRIKNNVSALFVVVVELNTYVWELATCELFKFQVCINKEQIAQFASLAELYVPLGTDVDGFRLSEPFFAGKYTSFKDDICCSYYFKKITRITTSQPYHAHADSFY